MEFDKKAESNTDKHVENEASTKEKKKRRSKKRLAAPVPMEIVAEEEKKTKEEEPKAKKTKKKTKKAVSAGAVTEQKKSEEVPSAKAETVEKPKRKKKSEEAGALKEVSHEEAVTKEHVTETPEVEPTDKSQASHESQSSEESAEITILPHETNEDEGDLFISERLRKSADKDEETDNTVSTSAASRPRRSTSQSSVTAASTGSSRTASATASSSATTGPAANTTGRTHVGGGSQPPYVPPSFANQAPFSGGPAVANVAPAASTTIERAPYRSRTAERRNLVAGIILGGVIEHIRHKRREKRVKTAHEREIKKLKDEQQFQQAEQYRNEQKSERTKTALEKQIDRLRQAVPRKATEQAGDAPRQEAQSTRADKLPLQETKDTKKTRPKAEVPSTFYEEFKQKYRAPEAVATTRVSNLQEQKPKTPEKPAPVPKQQPENIDMPAEVPSDRRVETSAWHRIEIDKKTGKAVEDPSIAYGEEFQNEQHQEQLRKQIAEASMETEKVKQSYLPIINKTSNLPSQQPPSTLLPPPAPPQSNQSESPLTTAMQKAKDTAANGIGIDIALWAILFLIIIAIIAVLF